MSLLKTIKNLLWRKRGLGYRPNKTDHRDLQYVPMAAAAAGPSASLEEYATVVDQGSTSSCVGNAVAGAISIMEKKSDHQYSYPSRMFLYWNSRRRHQEPPLSDDGTYIRECFKALAKLGVPDETYWPFKKSQINSKPRPYKPWEMADPRKNGQYLAVGFGKIKQALSEGYPVVFGTQLAESFMSSTGSDVIDKPDSSETLVGWHAMVIVGYRTVNGQTQYRVLNSWGKGWRDGGFCWFTEDYITWMYTGDFTICRGWKRIAS